jgi:hypothetical protein
MKTRKWLILILVAALLAVYYIIGSDYFKQRQQSKSLTAQINAAAQELALIPVPPADLDERLAAAQESLQVAKNSFNTDTNDINIVNTVLHVAEETGVKAIPLGTAPWVKETVSDTEYSVFRIELEVTGTFSQLLSFLDRLEGGEPESLIIEYLAVETINDSSNVDGEDTDAVSLKTDIKLAVYALLATND